MRKLSSALAFAAVLCAGSFVGAQPQPGPTAPPSDAAARATGKTVVPAGPGQRDVVILLEGELVRVVACDDAKTCDASGGTSLRPPESVRRAVPNATVETLEVEGGKRLALVTIGATGSRPYAVLLASRDKKASAPVVLFSGFLGKDADGSTKLDVEKAKGKASVTITTRGFFCNTEVTTSVRTLDRAKLTLVDQAVADPAGAKRAAVTELKAGKLASAAPRHQVLQLKSASSGDGAKLADGDPKTSWVEADRMPGSKSFVSLTAPADIPISGFDVVVSPPAQAGGAHRAPKKLLLVTDAGAFGVELAEDALASGGVFGVDLPKPVSTGCVAIVVDGVFAQKGDGKADVSAFISEVSARTSFDAQTVDDLAKSLGGSGSDARLRESLLFAQGKAGVRAAVAAYPQLDAAGRDRARRIIDAASCDEKLRLYVPLLIGKDREETDRARDRIRRCGKEAAPQLAEAIRNATNDEVRGTYAEEAALLAPDLVTATLVDMLSKAEGADARRPLRRALAKGALRAAGVRAIDAVIGEPSFASLSPIARIDVLRALGPAIKDAPRAASAFGEVAGAVTEFGDRYLLLGPAAELARAGDAGATVFLETTLAKSEDPRLRARAAELGAGIDKLAPLLVAAIDDEKVRVREAALLSLTTGGRPIEPGLRAKLAERLETDPWTFVRLAAASALAGAPADEAVDARIAAAVNFEEQPSVRAEIVRALGARGATKQKGVIRERAFDQKEAISVRLRAVEALGQVCDRDATSELAELANKGATPMFESDRKLAAAAITALVRLQPRDLKQVLAPLLADTAAPDMRDIAQRALVGAPPSPCK